MKTLALRVLKSCGTFALARGMSANGGRILAYHNFSDHGETRPNEVNISAARAQLEYLRRHFRVVPLSRLVEQLASGAPLEPYSVALTVDDGRHNVYDLFFPLLKEFEMPATFFVVSSFTAGRLGVDGQGIVAVGAVAGPWRTRPGQNCGLFQNAEPHASGSPQCAYREYRAEVGHPHPERAPAQVCAVLVE